MLHVTRRITISAPRESVRLYLRDLKNISLYEQKATAVEVVREEGDAAEVKLAGNFLSLPWRGEFALSFSPDGGYRCQLKSGSFLRMGFSFHLRPVAGGTVLTHEEHFQLPLLLRPFSFLVARRLWRSMELELGVIKEGAEALNRRIQLREIESLA